MISETWQKIVIPIAAVLISWIAHTLLFLLLRWAARKTPWPFDDELVCYSKWPLFVLFPIIAVLVALANISVDPNTFVTVQRIFIVLLIAGIGYLACNMVRLAALTLIRANKVESENNLHARIAHTQVQVFKRLCYGFIAVICAACIVFTFPAAWQIGASLLASAGVMGIIIGIAAKPILENSLSSLIIAVTRPILLDDEVIIDGEYGRVEAIHSMYVVVRTWDARRLIIPLSRIFTSTFENWSRRSPWKIGTIFIYLDPSVPVDALRTIYMDKVLPSSGGLWDGKVANCAVTDVTSDGFLQIRFLASAQDPSKAFDLRCHVREKVVEAVQQRWPWALIRHRLEISTSMPKHVLNDGDRLDPLMNQPVRPRPLSDQASLETIRQTSEKVLFDGLARGNLDDAGHHDGGQYDGGHHQNVGAEHS
ncbi:uncharacterized protein SPPG_02582 [Spizellomyces punctatus DAOM BR117]|uniref:Mechanosensitive ion channel MscS domain-containing protein n=1 Tax=Spizellomyces punctatus (strain DAOM BR117) TaxID=645134 RepID=A0A0L0HKY3_SPIPD|nr:uncharacterized protein SPPG_02582 [Spizellomyces punctatus DAOM BR117]KND02081.1 hypothetical protein SPPG_02582 [Spizellomyces punctatus DAOM BR117]|eukprot:XP_016610120.1 hypothetical protein SPPG_02582 [Spizellomyces punctatus DAOM BR117]